MLRSCATPSLTYSLSRNPVLGRGFANILDAKVSREHVRLEDRADGYAVVALGRNGVGMGDRVLRPGDTPGFLRVDEEIQLLPGSHRFILAAPPPAPSQPPADAEPAVKRQRNDCGDVEVGGGGAGSSGGDASSGGGDASSGGGGASGGGGDDDDWTSLKLPPYSHPAKPSAPAGLDALARLAMNPEAAEACNIFLLTRDLVVAYDVYPKGRVHLLILPRSRRIDNLSALTPALAPLVRKCARLGAHIASALRRADPDLAPLVMGFHAVPSMRQLYAPAPPLATRGMPSSSHLPWPRGMASPC